jgi:hypothetical protein
MIWLYGRFSQKLAELGVGIVPRQGWSAAEAFKKPTFGSVFVGALLSPGSFNTSSETVTCLLLSLFLTASIGRRELACGSESFTSGVAA